MDDEVIVVEEVRTEKRKLTSSEKFGKDAFSWTVGWIAGHYAGKAYEILIIDGKLIKMIRRSK
jgi:hypothetical protein